ncbi:polyphosphoinositide phosphatase [[Candida] railenensis]|uniref:Polyphosphoinositide phosphatase n=1 Tax=[Candida] railenensis TaxID=45579 RepID=A0A9P0QRP7_9ASCO|nr:polyphosphoinositide phosphatase [[Candida] railenensis]
MDLPLSGTINQGSEIKNQDQKEPIQSDSRTEAYEIDKRRNDKEVESTNNTNLQNNDKQHLDHTDSRQNNENNDEDPRSEEADESESGNLPEFNNKRIVLQRFTVYNSLRTMYIVGSNAKESLFRILEICKDPNDAAANLEIIEDKSYFYTRKDMIELLNGLNDSLEGGIYKIARGYGILGLIKFTKGYYLSLITKCSQVAILGGHFIYHVDETKLIPLDTKYRRPDKYSDEERLLSIFKYLDLGKTFYFSYSYDITNTLQTNFIRQKKHAEKNQNMQNEGEDPNGGNKFNASSNLHSFDPFNSFEHNERFVWNKLLLKPILQNQDIAIYEWFQPIIHGFVDQANISIYGKKIYITIIARRSHHFAGARFLKRGVNDKGNVANEIETEQIVTDMLLSSFHDPKYGFFSNPRFTSFVQHRGSIPLYWTQDLNRLPKPPIEINLSDPFYQSSAIHFNNLFERYGSPIIILNLIKTKEKVPRESKLNEHFVNCVKYLNQFLPDKHRLQMHSFDMSKHSKKNLDVIGPLQEIAASSLNQIGFFHNGIDIESTKIQKGIIRTNCIDCLDRTNAAQFIICKEALCHQLSSLKLISDSTTLDYDSDLINILTEIFHDHGDTIAVQYGGSNLVNTMDSYRRINQWSSHTRDMLNSIKRIYSNSFMDSIRQEAINLFLGNYIYDPNKPKLWELQNDFYLHNNTLIEDIRVKRSYQHWYNEKFLNEARFILTSQTEKPLESDSTELEKIVNAYGPFPQLEAYPEYNDNWFNECYVPRKFQSFGELFQFNMNSNARYFPSNISNDFTNKFDYSPFETRKPTFRISKSNEMLNASNENATRNAGLKYLESSGDDGKYDEGDDYEDGDEVTINEKEHDTTMKYSETDSSKASKSNRTSSSNYLNMTNPNKIKNFLTTKIEKFGYTTGQLQDHNENESQKSYSDSYTHRMNEKEHKRDVNISGTPQISPEDLKLYKAQSDSPITVPKLPSTTSLNTGIRACENDSNIYMYYTNRLVHGNDHTFDNKMEIFDNVANLDLSDANIYKKYLGVDDDKNYDFDAEDNYFR